MQQYNTIYDLKNQIQNKTVTIRIDANVPMNNGKITDLNRLIMAKKSIDFVLNNGAKKVVLISHFGRPKKYSSELSLLNIKPDFENILSSEVFFATDIDAAIQSNSKIVLLENLRFHTEEESGDEIFAKQLSTLGDFYINDAFSCSHRSHASISVVGKFQQIYAGILMLEEIETIESILNKKSGSSLAIVGGSKVSTKISLLENLVKKMDYIFVAGGMANTFLYAKGYNVGVSLHEADLKNTALNIIKIAEENNCQLLLPTDVIVANKIQTGSACKNVNLSEIENDDIIVDAGVNTVSMLVNILEKTNLFVWNGPLGIFEVPPFNVGTFSFARSVATRTRYFGLQSIIGGGDSAAAILEAGLKDEMTFVSTAGGAFLEWLEGKVLPGVESVYKK